MILLLSLRLNSILLSSVHYIAYFKARRRKEQKKKDCANLNESRQNDCISRSSVKRKRDLEDLQPTTTCRRTFQPRLPTAHFPQISKRPCTHTHTHIHARGLWMWDASPLEIHRGPSNLHKFPASFRAHSRNCAPERRERDDLSLHHRHFHAAVVWMQSYRLICTILFPIDWFFFL